MGGCQLNTRLPLGIAPSEYETRLTVSGNPLREAHRITVLPPDPWKPRVASITDGVNQASHNRVESRAAKVVIEDVAHPEEFSFDIAGLPVANLRYDCRDPTTSTWDFSFDLTSKIPPGNQMLEVKVNGYHLATVNLEIVSS
jgi:hypothetical protein